MNNNNPRPAFYQHKLMLPLMLIAGLAFLLVLVKTQPPMEHQNRAAFKSPVNVITARTARIRPEIQGFGEVKPDILLNVSAEVSGRITYVQPQLEKGTMLPKGTEVIRIDDGDYKLTIKQAEADVSVNKANLTELNLNEKDLEIRLSLAQKKLNIAGKELKRNQSLYKKKAISQSKVDSARTNVIQLELEVQTYKSQLATLPAQRDVLNAKIEIAHSKVSTQQRNLDRTHILLPFNARIDQLSVEEGQFVATGTPLFAAQTTDKVQIDAQFTPASFQKLAANFKNGNLLLKQALLQHDTRKLFSQLGLKAHVTLTGLQTSGWDADVEQISNTLDASTRTLGITLSVSNPYEKVQPGQRPPLLEGMYTRVTLSGNTQTFIIIPRNALHEGELYTVSPTSTLQRIQVKPYLLQDQMALFELSESSPLKPDMHIIISDPFPALNNMQVAASIDKTAQEALDNWTIQRAIPSAKQ